MVWDTNLTVKMFIFVKIKVKTDVILAKQESLNFFIGKEKFRVRKKVIYLFFNFYYLVE